MVRTLEAQVLERLLVLDAQGLSAIRTAVDLLEAYPERPWTAGLLAAEVGLSVRALHAGFRSTTELAPMTYLRRARLARLHDLLHAGPASTTVRSVAHRRGFAHLGRFAAPTPSGTGSPRRPP